MTRRILDRYTIVTPCSVPLTDVRVVHRPTRRDAWTAELERRRTELIDDHIRRGRPLLADERGVLPLLYRLERVDGDETAAEMVLHTTETDYAEYLLTNQGHPEWRSAEPEVMADPLGVSAVLRTADHDVLLGLRSMQTHDAPRTMHVVPSGHPHPPQTPRDAVLAELRDELGLGPDLVETAVATGVVRAQPSGKPELTCRLVTTESTAATRSRWNDAPERWEFDEIRTLTWEPLEVRAWLTGAGAVECVAPGHAAILLAGRIDFGLDWYHRCLRELEEAPGASGSD